MFTFEIRLPGAYTHEDKHEDCSDIKKRVILRYIS